MKGKNVDFTKGSVARNILGLAFPLMAAQFVNIFYNIADRIYISHIEGIGIDALTGVGIAFPIITIISAFAHLIAMGGGSLSSIYRGRGDDDTAEKLMGNSFSILLIIGVTVTVIGYLFKKPILYAFGASDVTFPYGNDYISIYLMGTVFVLFGSGMNSFINAQGYAKTAMLTVMIGAVINIILDPIFIYYFGLGVEGAAIATVISQFVSAAWVFIFLRSERSMLKLRVKNLRLDLRLVWKIVSLGLSGFIMAVTASGVQIIANSALSRFGGDIYVTVMTVITSIREMLTLVVQGITSGSQPVLGYNYGAKRYDRVRSGIKFITLVCFSYTITTWLLIMCFPTVFVKMFNSDARLLELSKHCVRINFAAHFMMAFQFSGQSTFVGLGKAKEAIFFSLLRKAIIVIPLTLLLPYTPLGTDGVFYAEPVSAMVGASCCYAVMYFTVYRKMKIKE
ncbi:MAG: MATE family efflux transporter [Firmicutes bacterium]|nr:MATE family efflux transporter [Bacillota bacterium]